MNEVVDNLGATVIESGRNGDTWYRSWSDGWLEQGGAWTSTNSVGVRTVTFEKPYSINPFVSLSSTGLKDTVFKDNSIENEVGITVAYLTQNASMIGQVTNTYFKAQERAPDKLRVYYACGYGA